MSTAKLLLPLIWAAASWTSPVAAQPDIYRGKTINLMVGSGEGGGFDLSARLVAQFLPRFIPGSPTIVVQNMPGASGLRVAEYMSNVAPRDGSVIAITQPSMVQHKVLNASARVDAWHARTSGTEFHHLDFAQAGAAERHQWSHAALRCKLERPLEMQLCFTPIGAARYAFNIAQQL